MRSCLFFRHGRGQYRTGQGTARPGTGGLSALSSRLIIRYGVFIHLFIHTRTVRLYEVRKRGIASAKHAPSPSSYASLFLFPLFSLSRSHQSSSPLLTLTFSHSSLLIPRPPDFIDQALINLVTALLPSAFNHQTDQRKLSSC